MENAETNLSDLTSRLDKLLQVARGYESALSFALRAEDEHAVRHASLRLEKLIAASYHALDSANIEDSACRAMLSTMLEQATKMPAQLLVRSFRYWPEGRSTFHVEVDIMDQPALVGLRRFRRQCCDLALQNLHILNCDVGMDFSGSSFVQVKISDCDFSVCRLNGTLWQEVRVERTSFYGSDFSDARIGDAVFVDCDFRNVSLDNIQVSPLNARLIRCNVADIKLGSPSADGIHLINCRGVEPPLQPPSVIC